MATHSNVLAWEVPRTEKLGRVESMGLQEELDMTSNETAQQSYSQDERVSTRERTLTVSGAH